MSGAACLATLTASGPFSVTVNSKPYGASRFLRVAGVLPSASMISAVKCTDAGYPAGSAVTRGQPSRERA
jgi:hypothetical protein